MSYPKRRAAKAVNKTAPANAVKTVRIDSNTQVVVPITMSDEDARNRYFSLHSIKKPPQIAPQPRESEEIEPKVVPLEEIIEAEEDEE